MGNQGACSRLCDLSPVTTTDNNNDNFLNT